MNKSKFYIIRLKKLVLPLILILFTCSLIIFSKTNLNAAKNGLILWANSIVPTLFPFFVAAPAQPLMAHKDIFGHA